jgi:hypothetical protein
MSDTQYSIDEVTVSWTVPVPPPNQPPSLDLKVGTAKGSQITEARTGARWTLTEDGTGSAHYVEMPGSSGTLTLRVVQQSALNQRLSERMIADRLTKNQVGPLLVSDLSSGESWIFVNVRILQEPNMVRGDEGVVNEWTFGYTHRTHQPSSGNDNLVGGA